MSKENLKKREMDFLMGGNFCANGTENQKANNYSGKCSCFCGGDWGDYYDSLDFDAIDTKSSGTIVP
ncbi:MAG: rSAM-modified peptide [Mediterranea massiliensis]|nr:rSAM-modified peptide [Mediterranea massiliensis]